MQFDGFNHLVAEHLLITRPEPPKSVSVAIEFGLVMSQLRIGIVDELLGTGLKFGRDKRTSLVTVLVGLISLLGPGPGLGRSGSVSLSNRPLHNPSQQVTQPHTHLGPN